MQKLTIDELKKIREAARKDIYLRDGEFRGKIIVHTGTCGIAAGARDVVSAFMQELNTSGRRDIIITTTGCAGLCSREPMATVELRDAAPVRYGDLDSEKVRRIFREHVQGGLIVQDVAIGIGSERG
ncbi:MAG: (2Fe-2S) ferredoxin domain-containing protein [Acidobacteriota bacterium]|jgi:NADP-reducing hydrogenase subunit HndB